MSEEQVSWGGELRPPKLSHMVANRLRVQIVSGLIKTGSTLPPESELLTIFKVSRPTLREALRILEAESLISIGRGVRTGAVVLGATVGKMAEYATVFLASKGVTMLDLHEARTIFEPAIIQALATRPKDVVEHVVHTLSTLLEELRRGLAIHDYGAVVDATQRFHGHLAQLSGNRTIALFVTTLHLISDDVYASAILQIENDDVESLQRNMVKTVAGYERLVDLLLQRKFDEATNFWTRYMEGGQKFLRATRLGARQVGHGSMGDASPIE
ncbi:FadR/GntR family transcriptional regulator [Rhizorhabdus wittichii]|uniref:FadR/GntR family transcriptional regulator n=1 Tax=Rhizorhabdus wittichii TaxID=160791 RepID=UPI000301AD25|nr:GntR family transcriptional regulator [Rhizorhabdus wittichii]